MEAIHYNHLFQSFLCGRGKACMIVNINQCSTTFDETLHVLLLLFASSSDFFPLVNPVVPGLGRRTPRSCLLASSTV